LARQCGDDVFLMLVTGAPPNLRRHSPAHHGQLAIGADVTHYGHRIGGRLPTYRFITRKRARMASWFVVIE
jgi:hypothetical protein